MKGYINKRIKVFDGLSEATGVYIKSVSKTFIEFLANDSAFLNH